MKTISARVLLLPLLAGGLAAEPVRLTPEQAAPLRVEHQVSVQIKQVYSWQELDDEGNVKEDKADASDAEKKPRDLLPLAEETAKAIEFAGWRSAPAGASVKVKIELDIYGRALAGEYTGTVSGYQYSGAQLSGHMVMWSDGGELLRESIFAKHAPPYSVNQFYHHPWSAPFNLLAKDCLAAVYHALEAVHGPGPLLAAVNSEDSLQREAATMALCARGGADLQPALLELLRQGDAERRTIAAVLLGVVGDARVLDPLLEALRASAGEEKTNSDYHDHEWEDLMRFDHEPEDLAARRHTAPPLAKWPELDAVLWALLQNPAPDKAARLAVALGDEKMPALARSGVALALGKLDDRAADPALVAATRARSPLVQAGALTTLKGHRFRESSEAAAAALALTTSAHPRVRALARETVAEFSLSRSDQYLAAKYGKDPSRHPRNAHEELLTHADPLLRLAGVAAIPAAAPDELSPVARLLRSDSAPCVREAAIKLLASYHPDKHTEDFIFALADPDESTRCARCRP